MSAFDTEKWAEHAINAILRNASHEEALSFLPLIYAYAMQTDATTAVGNTLAQAEEGKQAITNATQTLAVCFASVFFKLPFEELLAVTQPLLNCCSIYLTPGQHDLCDPIMNNPNQYIEEPSTFFTLKREGFKLHTDFFMNAAKRYLIDYLRKQDNR
ncbi:hypothetical protein COMNV_00838 [Commensalibacter sp. Nvir]|nr:hypothetical protein COMNV_00838 [Commensalibacter sp. Nvir]